MITESVFSYPGMGLLFYQQAQSQDYPVLLGITVVVAVATVVGSLLADMTYAMLARADLRRLRPPGVGLIAVAGAARSA